jgi:putative proteasome-type protease
MSYCLGILLNEGLVFAADTRTNAGVDNVSTYRKLHVFEKPGERVIAVLTVGNLAITQSVVTQIEAGLENDPERTLYTVDSLYDAARLVGRALRNVHAIDGEHLKALDTEFNAAFIVGGQIAGQRMRLFQVYSAGNFIEASEDTPYIQIGEAKYGKPILDRVITPRVELLTAAKCALVSFDSTMRSNLSVGAPIDILIYKRDTQRIATRQRLTNDDSYFSAIRNQWGGGLRQLFDTLPNPAWTHDIE